MNVKLTTVSRDPNLSGGLRTTDVVGDAADLPVAGSRFSMTAPPLDPGAGIRYISTSPVQEVKAAGTDVYDVVTKSGSRYRVEVLPS